MHTRHQSIVKSKCFMAEISMSLKREYQRSLCVHRKRCISAQVEDHGRDSERIIKINILAMFKLCTTRVFTFPFVVALHDSITSSLGAISSRTIFNGVFAQNDLCKKINYDTKSCHTTKPWISNYFISFSRMKRLT
jgi:hypothetical protein